MGKYKYIEILNLTGEIVAVYTSTAQACRVTGANSTTLQKAIKENGKYSCFGRNSTLYLAEEGINYNLKPVEEETE